MTTHWRLFPVAIATVLLAACQGVVQSVGGEDVAGYYSLMQVDGVAIPGDVSHDDVDMHIRSGMLMISNDGTCFSRTRFVPPGGNETTREVSCKYRVEDDRLMMRWKGAGTTEATVQDGVFVMDNHGMIFRYEKTG